MNKSARAKQLYIPLPGPSNDNIATPPLKYGFCNISHKDPASTKSNQIKQQQPMKKHGIQVRQFSYVVLKHNKKSLVNRDQINSPQIRQCPSFTIWIQKLHCNGFYITELIREKDLQIILSFSQAHNLFWISHKYYLLFEKNIHLILTLKHRSNAHIGMCDKINHKISKSLH